MHDTLITASWARAPKIFSINTNPSQVVSLGLAAISCLFVEYGAGHHQDLSTSADMIATKKLTFANRIVYQFVLGTTKLGICSFYLRIFQDKWSKRFIYALLAFILVAALTMEFTIIFSCKPVSDAWALGEKDCLPPQPSYIGNTIANVFSDLALMAFVIPKICEFFLGDLMRARQLNISPKAALQIPRRQKIYIFSVVSLGILVVIASIFRLISIIRFNNSPDLACKSSRSVPRTLLT